MVLEIRTPLKGSNYEIQVGPGLLSEAGKIARRALDGGGPRVALISNQRVLSIFGQTVESSLKANGFKVSTLTIGDGERFKSFHTLEKVLDFLQREGLDRSDQVITLGGGVVGDVAGFAASVYMRGIPFIQIPTTLLAQIDASIGGKTGINLPAGKNLVGSFYQPRAVIIDTETLKTLPNRDLSAGWFEAVKHGAVSGKKLFNLTTGFLRESNPTIDFRSPEFASLIRAHLAFKASIVASDEREAIGRNDQRSRKVLNFGHTLAHALEAITGYKRFRHGEAVGHGMLVAGAISKNLGLLDSSELELLRDGVRLCGKLPSASDLSESALIKAINSDKKRIGSSVQWVLLERIGSPKVVAGGEISPALLKESLKQALRDKTWLE